MYRQRRLWDKINWGTVSSNYARHPYILMQCQYDHLFFVLLSIQTTFCQLKIQIQNCFVNNIVEDMPLYHSQILPLYPSISKNLSLIHISEPTRLLSISYAVFCLKKK